MPSPDCVRLALRLLLIALLSLVVLAGVCACANLHRARTARPRAARRGGRVLDPGAAERFTWADVTVADAQWFEQHEERQVPPGNYASAPMNQHVHAWCGACWLVACVQVVQDKLNIREAPLEPAQRDHRAFVFDMQAAADDAARLFSAEVQGRERSVGLLVARPRQWTACMGGDPAMALEALRAGRLQLAAQRRGHVAWQSRSDAARAGRVPGDAVVRGVRTVEPTVEAIQRELLAGPIVVCTRSDPLWHLDDAGRTPVGSGERDHVMALIGWDVVEGERCWIARNSWGNAPRSLVHARPEDVRGCAGGLCASDRTEWQSRGPAPGFVFIPMDYKQNAMGLYDAPSGCFAVDV